MKTLIQAAAFTLFATSAAHAQLLPLQVVPLPANTAGISECSTIRVLPGVGKVTVLVGLAWADLPGATDAGLIRCLTFGPNGSIISQSDIQLPTPITNGVFGDGFACDGTTLMVNTGSTGSVHFFRREGDTFVLDQSLTGITTTNYWNAQCWVSGDRAVVGDPGHSSARGRFLTLSRSGGAWTVDRAISAPTPIANRNFAGGLFATADRIVASEYTNPPAGCVGRVFVYNANDLDAPPLQLPAPSTTSGCSLFGTGVSGNDDIIAVGGRDDGASGSQSGAVFIYERNGAAWNQVLYSGPSASVTNGEWGFSSTNGTSVVVWGLSPAFARVPVSIFGKGASSWGLSSTLTLPAAQPGALRASAMLADTTFASVVSGNNIGLAVFASQDCNANGLGDKMEIELGMTADANADGVPDCCESGGSCLGGGTCAVFARPTDTAKIATNTSFAGDYTIEWSGFPLNQAVATNPPATYNARIWSEQDSVTEDKGIGLNSDRTPSGWVNTTCFSFMSGPTPLPVVQRIHVALVRSGDTRTLYVNGAAVSTSQEPCTPLNGSGSNMALGAFVYVGQPSTNYWRAAPVALDWVRVSNAARYASGFSPPAEGSLGVDGATQLLMTFEGANPWVNLANPSTVISLGVGVAGGTRPEISSDCDGNGIPDQAELGLPGTDNDGNGVLDVCEQPTCEDADLYPNGIVDGADLGILLSEWGQLAQQRTQTSTEMG